MKITIDRELKEYVKKKKIRYINVELVRTGVCWGAGTLPEVRIGRPEHIDEFDVHKVEDLFIYVHKGVHSKEGRLHFKYSKFLFFGSIEVFGVVII